MFKDSFLAVVESISMPFAPIPSRKQKVTVIIVLLALSRSDKQSVEDDDRNREQRSAITARVSLSSLYPSVTRDAG